mgnify:CR=1 FL=1
MKQLQLIEESYTCLDKPLLEYVYEVDNYFLPDYQDRKYSANYRY